jgi:acyl-CoA thioester hydrolase
MPRVLTRPLEVPAESIDAMGHANNKEHLRWMEEIAIAHSEAQGWPMERYAAQGGAWYVRSHFVEYLRPALPGVALTVATWVATMERRSSLRRYAFVRTADRKIVALAETLWTFVDPRSGRAVDIPAALRESFPLVAEDDPELAALGVRPRR